MKRNTLTILLLFITGLGFAQDFKYKDQKFDLKIFDYLVERTDKESTSLETFLQNTKPFSKWDMRPLKDSKVWAMDNTYSASEIPNFFWGAFSQKYELSSEEALNKPDVFIKKGMDEKNNHVNFLKTNLEKINQLSTLISKSENHIYVNQKTLQRIDQIFKENSNYWYYLIPTDSPFPISAETKIDTETKFTNQQNTILDQLNDLKIYAAIKTKKGIFYLLDGFTDNSYGFFYNPEGIMETDNILFEIKTNEKINLNYFYYVGN